jgi:hypothetical protein
MKISQKVIILFAVCIFVLYSCVPLNNKKLSEVSAILSESPDALEAVLEAFQKSDIVFIGGASHQLLNEKYFIRAEGFNTQELASARELQGG